MPWKIGSPTFSWSSSSHPPSGPQPPKPNTSMTPSALKNSLKSGSSNAASPSLVIAASRLHFRDSSRTQLKSTLEITSLYIFLTASIGSSTADRIEPRVSFKSFQPSEERLIFPTNSSDCLTVSAILFLVASSKTRNLSLFSSSSVLHDFLSRSRVISFAKFANENRFPIASYFSMPSREFSLVFIIGVG